MISIIISTARTLHFIYVIINRDLIWQAVRKSAGSRRLAIFRIRAKSGARCDVDPSDRHRDAPGMKNRFAPKG